MQPDRLGLKRLRKNNQKNRFYSIFFYIIFQFPLSYSIMSSVCHFRFSWAHGVQTFVLEQLASQVYKTYITYYFKAVLFLIVLTVCFNPIQYSMYSYSPRQVKNLRSHFYKTNIKQLSILYRCPNFKNSIPRNIYNSM